MRLEPHSIGWSYLRFDRERVGAVALDLVAQRADHLRMAGVAALADVDVAARQLERRVDPHVGRVLDRLVDGEERRDLDDAADAGDGDDAEHEADRLAFQPVVESEHGLTPPAEALRREDRPACPPASCGCGAVRIVIQML